MAPLPKYALNHMPFPFYRQPDSMDCGPSCLQMIAKHYGKNVSLQRLRQTSQAGRDGVSLLGISDAAESIGLRTQTVRLTFDTLTEDVLLPCILHWDQNHFVVLYNVRTRPSLLKFMRNGKGKTMYVADPARGLVSLPEAEFLPRWISNQNKQGSGQGVALLIEPSPIFETLDEESSSAADSEKKLLAFKNIFNYIVPYRKLVAQLFIGMCIASVLQLMLPFLTQSVVDVGINTSNIHFVYIVLLAQLALFAGRLVTDFVRGWILLHISTRVNVSILTDFLIKLMKLPVSFFDSKKMGDILQRMNDHQRIESFLTSSSISVLFSVLNLLVFSIVLAVFNVPIFIVFATSSVIYSIWVIVFLKHRKQLDYKRFDIASKEQSATIQLVQGMQEIKLNGIEKRMRWKWERLQARLFQLSMKGLSLNQWQQSGASFINESKNIFITFLSAKAVIDGQMTLGAMLAVQYIIGQLNSPIEQMIGFVQSWQNARLSMNRLNEIHEMEDEEPAHRPFLQELPLDYTRHLSGGRDFSGIHQAQERLLGNPDKNTYEHYDDVSPEEFIFDAGPERAIILSNVSFTYAGVGNSPVLKDIQLKIPKGKTTAIVGVSGSGKTTLLKLLLKFYEPQKGDIRLGNSLLSNISHKVWRRHCGAVMQESFIFSDTIAQNIAIGDEYPDMEKLYEAVEAANIRSFIESLPLGFNTKIGTEGIGISMGQKQRILIARAVYRDPAFIFFDEATNSLDANNERLIIDNLRTFFKDRTVVVVAHRLSTVKHADQIVVLNKGSISERGTHQELVNLKGEYYTLVKNQLELGG